MTQLEIDRQVATATGESLADIHRLGFGIADLFEPRFDPEPRGPLMYDWDANDVAAWPER